MRTVLASFMCLLVLAGCDPTGVRIDEAKVEKDSVHGEIQSGAVQSTITTQPGTITGTIAAGAVKVEKGVEVHPNAIHLETAAKTVDANVAAGAIKVEKGLEVNSPVTVSPNAIHFEPPQVTVAQGAVQICPALTIKIEPGAVVIRGAEIQKGAVEIPWWPFAGGMGLAGAGWAATKARKGNQQVKHKLKLASHGMPAADEPRNLWDILF